MRKEAIWKLTKRKSSEEPSVGEGSSRDTFSAAHVERWNASITLADLAHLSNPPKVGLVRLLQLFSSEGGVPLSPRRRDARPKAEFYQSE